MNFTRILNEKLEEWVLVGATMLITILVLIQVFARFVVNGSVGWTEELARYLLIWIAWISASYAIQKKAHIQVDMLKNKFKGTWRKIIDLISTLVFFIMAAFLAVEGTNFVLGVSSTNQVSPSMGIPMWMIYLVVPIGGFLMCIRLIQQCILIFRSEETDNS